MDIDLIDSNEAMLVLNNLPNVQILNGRSTKDDDEEEEEENIEDDLGEIKELDNNEEQEIKNKFNNEMSNRHNNHLYSRMEEIEEYKNSENNSNYISESNQKTKTVDNMEINEQNENININNSETENEINSSSKDKENLNNSKEKDKKITRNKNVLNEKEFNPKIDSNNEQNISNNTSQNKQNTGNSLKKKTESQSQKDNKSINNGTNTVKIEKERESFYEYNNSNLDKNNNCLIDITTEELNLIKGKKYNENSKFISLIKDFYSLINKEKEQKIDDEKIKNNYLKKIKTIEEKKNDVTNYYYLYLLNKKKIKVIQNMISDLILYIIGKNPEFDKNNILKNLNEELFNTIKDYKDMIFNLHNHIESFSYNSPSPAQTSTGCVLRQSRPEVYIFRRANNQ